MKSKKSKAGKTSPKRSGGLPRLVAPNGGGNGPVTLPTSGQIVGLVLSASNALAQHAEGMRKDQTSDAIEAKIFDAFDEVHELMTCALVGIRVLHHVAPTSWVPVSTDCALDEIGQVFAIGRARIQEHGDASAPVGAELRGLPERD